MRYANLKNGAPDLCFLYEMSEEEAITLGMIAVPEYAQCATYKWSGTTWVLNEEVCLAELRVQRNALLSESDWTQLPDAPSSIDKVAWAVYRQNLRDLPNTWLSNPVWTPIFPTKP